MGTHLLLGGSGFVGSSLARELRRRGESFRIADRLPSAVAPETWSRVEMCDAEAVTGALSGIDTLQLLAAEHGADPRPEARFEEVNVEGTRAVLAAARKAKLRRIVFTSTVAVYGRSPGWASEETRPAPTDPYGRTKLRAEGLLRDWAHEDRSRALVIVRPTVLFGPGVRGRMQSLFHQLAQPGFRLIGAGTNRKSFAQVDNLAAFLAHAAALGPGTHLFNYADGPDLTIAELAHTIRSAVGLPPALPVRSPVAMSVMALMKQARAAFGGAAPEWTYRQVRSFVSDARFIATRFSAVGFTPPLTLVDALRHYARSDLRWTAQRSIGASLSSAAVLHDVHAP